MLTDTEEGREGDQSFFQPKSPVKTSEGHCNRTAINENFFLLLPTSCVSRFQKKKKNTRREDPNLRDIQFYDSDNEPQQKSDSTILSFSSLIDP